MISNLKIEKRETMIKRHWLIGALVFFPFFTKAQFVIDTAQVKVKKTEIELVYNHYLQDGNNSAVTGGIGTEELTVYGPSLTIKRTSGKHAITFNTGSDIISSASTDNIDYIVSSASSMDARSYLDVKYERELKQDISVFGGGGVSVESDYLSINSKVGFFKKNKRKGQTYLLELQMYNDDLRWGRLDDDEDGPVGLIYPSELRFRQWYDGYRRNSFNLKLGFTQVINQRNILGVFPELAYQKGVLETPFHRVYFTDESLGVEQLPEERYKMATTLKLNSFIRGNVVLKNSINGYVDNFGIFAFSIENETAIKIDPFFTLLANVRFFQQRSSKYFKPYGGHQVEEEFYTSDYDLSNLRTYNLGMGLKYFPTKYLGRKVIFNAIVFRYNFMYRSNILRAHSLSAVFNFEWVKKSDSKY